MQVNPRQLPSTKSTRFNLVLHISTYYKPWLLLLKMGLAAPPNDPLFEPFIRSDQYGEAGHKISWSSAVRILLLSVTLLPCRVLGALMCVASYYILLRLLALLPGGALNRRIAAFWGRFWSTACLLALGFVRMRWVRVEPHSRRANKEAQPHWQVAIVSNHISWADILIQMSRYLPSFVAREGTQNIRMVGLIRWVHVSLIGQVEAAHAAASSVWPCSEGVSPDG